MIKSAKKALRAILGEEDVMDEELYMTMSAVEGLLNSRPIMYVSADPHDLTLNSKSFYNRSAWRTVRGRSCQCRGIGETNKPVASSAAID